MKKLWISLTAFLLACSNGNSATSNPSFAAQKSSGAGLTSKLACCSAYECGTVNVEYLAVGPKLYTYNFDGYRSLKLIATSPTGEDFSAVATGTWPKGGAFASAGSKLYRAGIGEPISLVGEVPGGQPITGLVSMWQGKGAVVVADSKIYNSDLKLLAEAPNQATIAAVMPYGPNDPGHISFAAGNRLYEVMRDGQISPILEAPGIITAVGFDASAIFVATGPQLHFTRYDASLPLELVSATPDLNPITNIVTHGRQAYAVSKFNMGFNKLASGYRKSSAPITDSCNTDTDYVMSDTKFYEADKGAFKLLFDLANQ